MRLFLLACLVLSATAGNAEVDKSCQATCAAKGFTDSFCTRVCSYDPAKGTLPAYNVPLTPEPPPPPEPKRPAPMEERARPPIAQLVPINPVEDELRDEVRRLKAENAALRRELATLRGGRR